MKKLVIAMAILGLAAAWAADFGGAPVTANQAAIVLKGEAVLDDATATIVLPTWFETTAKVSGRVVLVTCRNGVSPLSVSNIVDGQFTVTTNETGSPTQPFYWVIVADRN